MENEIIKILKEYGLSDYPNAQLCALEIAELINNNTK